MSETKFMPAPWVASFADDTTEFQVEAFDGGHVVCDGGGTLVDSPEETRANAHLIAAAPSLYAALVALADPSTEDYRDALVMADAALAKARGEATE